MGNGFKVVALAPSLPFVICFMSRPFLCSHVGHWKHFHPKPFKHSRPTRWNERRNPSNLLVLWFTVAKLFRLIVYWMLAKHLVAEKIFSFTEIPTWILRNSPKRIVLSRSEGTRSKFRTRERNCIIIVGWRSFFSQSVPLMVLDTTSGTRKNKINSSRKFAFENRRDLHCG